MRRLPGTTIPVSFKTKIALEEKKLEYEKKIQRRVKWDEYLEQCILN